jgi:23S rRNA pseudouridine2605 synthase
VTDIAETPTELGTERKRLTIKRSSDYAELRERLQKVLATSGLGARRGLEERILKGEILLNGEVPEMGAQVKAGDRISVDGKSFLVKLQEGDYGRILIYNKPDGEVTTRHDPEGRRTVFERLPRIKGARWIAIGRLDINTQGLLVFTTNGDLAQKLMHPENEFEREYLCRIHGEVTDEILAQLQAGVTLDDGPAAFAEIEAMQSSEGTNEWWRVLIKEGRNREVRRIWEAVGLQVSRLKRSTFGPFSLPKSLHRGEVVELESNDVVEMCKEMGIGQSPAQLIAMDEAGVRLRRVRESVDGKKKVITQAGAKAESYWTGERGYGGGNERPRRSAEFAMGDDRDSRRPKPGKSGKRGNPRGRRPASADVNPLLLGTTGTDAQPGQLRSRHRPAGARGARGPGGHATQQPGQHAGQRTGARRPQGARGARPAGSQGQNQTPGLFQAGQGQAGQGQAGQGQAGQAAANQRPRRARGDQPRGERPVRIDGDAQPNFDALESRKRKSAVRGPLGTSEAYFNSDNYGNSMTHVGHANQANDAGRGRQGRDKKPVRAAFRGPMDNPIPNYAHRSFEATGNDANGNVVGQNLSGQNTRGQSTNNQAPSNQAPRKNRPERRPQGPRPERAANAGAAVAPADPNNPNTNPNPNPNRNRKRRRRGGKRRDGSAGTNASGASTGGTESGSATAPTNTGGSDS